MTEPITEPNKIRETIEAVLFAAGHPVAYEKLARLFDMTPAQMKAFVSEYAAEYNVGVRGILLLCMEDCCQLCTKEEYINCIRDALDIRRGGNLSNSSIETLAIIAYNQPVTRSYVDTVRGVASDYAVNSLLDRGLIEPRGRLDAPGRPILYGTTTAFLRVFGLNGLSELPDVSGAGQAASVFENLTIDDMVEEPSDGTQSASESTDDAASEEKKDD